MSERKLLITGASGKLGQEVVRVLLEEMNVPRNNLSLRREKKQA